MERQQNMILYAITNLGIFLIYSFPPTYLFHFFTGSVSEGGLGFNIAQDFIRYLLISIGLFVGIFSSTLFGILSDKTKPVGFFGRRRIYILIFSPLTAFTFVLLTFPFFREALTINFETAVIYLIVVYIFYSIFLNAFNTPYMGLMAEITLPENRLKMSGLWNLIGGLGTVIGLVLPALISIFIKNWVFITSIYAIVLVITSMITVFTIREPRIIPQDSIKEKLPFREIIKNKKFLNYEIAQFFWNLAFNLVLASLPAVAAAIFGFETSQEFGVIAVILLMVIGAFFIMYLKFGEKWGRQRTLTIAIFYLAIIFPIGSILYFTKDLGNIFLQGMIFVVALSAGLAAIFVFPMSILMEIIQKNQEASYMGINTIFMNTSGAIGTLIMSIITYIYAENAFFVVCPILGGFLFISGFILKKYSLIEK